MLIVKIIQKKGGEKMQLKIGSIGISNNLSILDVICLSIFTSSSAYAGEGQCRFLHGNSVVETVFVAPQTIFAPRDAKVGSVIWKSDGTVPPRGHAWGCWEHFKWGLINSRGGLPPNPASPIDMPIGDTGLAWRYGGSNRDFPALLYGDRLPPSEGYRFDDQPQYLSIVKIGPIQSGVTIAAGTLGSVNIDGDFNVIRMQLAKSFTVATGSCKTPDVTVKMGDRNYVGQFKGVGTSLAPINFSIALNECPEGINKVSYRLEPTTELLDQSNAVVALDATSTAEGVGLQLLNAAGEPVRLKKRITFREYDKLGGNFIIPLKAAYHQIGPKVIPGRANTSVTFIMSYD